MDQVCGVGKPADIALHRQLLGYSFHGGRGRSTWGVLGGMVQLRCLFLVAACSAYLRSLGSYSRAGDVEF